MQQQAQGNVLSVESFKRALSTVAMCNCSCTVLLHIATADKRFPVACNKTLWRCCRRHLRPDDKHIVAEIEAMVTCGTLARVKSMHPDAGPLSPKLMRPSIGLNVCCNTGERGQS